MSGPHRIRLQAAWTGADSSPVWTRSFGSPTGVEAGDRVWLVIERPVACEATLNGRPLPAVVAGHAAWRHEVTAELLSRNELRLVFAGPTTGASADRAPLPESLGLVSLEIESQG